MTLIAAILLSVAVIVLDSVPELDAVVPASGVRNSASPVFTLSTCMLVYAQSTSLYPELLGCRRPTGDCAHLHRFCFQRRHLWWLSVYSVLRSFRVFRLVNLFSELNEILAVLRNTSRSILFFW